MYITVINENIQLSQSFIGNVFATVAYVRAEGGNNYNQVLVCRHINNPSSTPKTNYGLRGSLQFNLTLNTIPIKPLNYSKGTGKINLTNLGKSIDPSPKRAWSNYNTGVLFDVKGDTYEILKFSPSKFTNADFSGTISLRKTNDSNIVSDSQGDYYSGEEQYEFTVRKYMDSDV